MAGSERIGWRFGPFDLSPHRGLLRCEGAEVPLARKSFAVLAHLLRHRHRVVPRQEILDAVWPDVVVSEAAFASAIRDLRRALGDSGHRSRYVATVRGRGLRFVHEVEEIRDEDVERPGAVWAAVAADLERAIRALETLEAGRGGARRRGGRARERADLLVALARARWAAGATAEARDLFLHTALLAKRRGDGEALAQAALGYVGRTDMTPGVNRRGVRLMEEALRILPEKDAPLRAELLARLATELVFDPGASRSESLAREAVAMAERLGDRPTLGYALTALHFVLQGPAVPPRVRLPLTERVFGLVSTPSDVRALAGLQRVTDHLELADGEGFSAALARFGTLTAALDLPFFAWMHALLTATAALVAGRLAEAEKRAQEALELGRRAGSPNADGAFAAQLFGVRREQGRLGELRAGLGVLAERHRALPVYRAGHAAAVAASGDPEGARAALDELLGRGLEDLPRDRDWLPTLATLAPAVAELGPARRVRCLIDHLEPHRDRLVVAGHGATVLGAASHHLGRLRRALGDESGAARELAHAREVYARLGAPRWLEQVEDARRR